MVEKNWKLRLLNLQTLISYLDDMNITRSSKFQIQLRMFFWEGGWEGDKMTNILKLRTKTKEFRISKGIS